MEENKEKDIEDLFFDAKEYIDTRIEYTRLSAVEKGSKIFADLITNGAVIICFILAFLFGTFTLALYLSDVLGSHTRGFGCVAAIYLLLAIIFYFAKDKFIERYLVSLFIRKYFDKVADKDDDDEEK
ncbi:phage holin family protein [Pedobacter sp. LMG 31464]|uniref:Phage holin family protein n=1 Tax=Pedobacter planticolens TaxID=2679964 RepID=A0A923E156_9SPHI|nr:phage holin family protein [Pedobacter planticolens]MBB2146163.1 phage holin family protein [Pedobacter planticolens]